eukprot:682430-Ditylum_brightwellii.AAC.1
MTKAVVTMVALNLCPFITIAEAGFKEVLYVCMEIACKTHADKAREGLAAELRCILEEHIRVTVTTHMTTKDFTKVFTQY